MRRPGWRARILRHVRRHTFGWLKWLLVFTVVTYPFAFYFAEQPASLTPVYVWLGTTICIMRSWVILHARRRVPFNAEALGYIRLFFPLGFTISVGSSLAVAFGWL